MDRPLRALQPAGPLERPQDLAPVPSQPGRRKHIGVACNACRKRKSRCDGKRPTCYFCTIKHTECVYDASRRKSVDVQARNTQLEDDLNSVLTTFEHLQRCPSPEAQDIYRRIRGGEDIWTMYDQIISSGAVQTPGDDIDIASVGGSSSQPAHSTAQDGEMSEQHDMAMQMPQQRGMSVLPSHRGMEAFASAMPDSGLPWLQHQGMDNMSHLHQGGQYDMYPFEMPGMSAQGLGSDILADAARQMREQQDDDDLEDQG